MDDFFTGLDVAFKDAFMVDDTVEPAFGSNTAMHRNRYRTYAHAVVRCAEKAVAVAASTSKPYPRELLRRLEYYLSPRHSIPNPPLISKTHVEVIHEALTQVSGAVVEIASWFDPLAHYSTLGSRKDAKSRDLSDSMLAALRKDPTCKNPDAATRALVLFFHREATGLLLHAQTWLMANPPPTRPDTSEAFTSSFMSWITDANPTQVSKKTGKKRARPQKEASDAYAPILSTKYPTPQDLYEAYGNVVAFMKKDRSTIDEARTCDDPILRYVAATSCGFNDPPSKSPRRDFFRLGAGALLEDMYVAAYRQRLLSGPFGTVRKELVRILSNVPSLPERDVGDALWTFADGLQVEQVTPTRHPITEVTRGFDAETEYLDAKKELERWMTGSLKLQAFNVFEMRGHLWKRILDHLKEVHYLAHANIDRNLALDRNEEFDHEAVEVPERKWPDTFDWEDVRVVPTLNAFLARSRRGGAPDARTRNPPRGRATTRTTRTTSRQASAATRNGTEPETSVDSTSVARRQSKKRAVPDGDDDDRRSRVRTH